MWQKNMFLKELLLEGVEISACCQNNSKTHWIFGINYRTPVYLLLYTTLLRFNSTLRTRCKGGKGSKVWSRHQCSVRSHQITIDAQTKLFHIYCRVIILLAVNCTSVALLYYYINKEEFSLSLPTSYHSYFGLSKQSATLNKDRSQLVWFNKTLL